MITSPREVYAWTGDVLVSLRRSLDAHGFAEILPAVLSERFEPGARHSVAVLGERALPDIDVDSSGQAARHVTVAGAEYYYLPVSHCIEKQLALEHADRVYCIAPCVRLLMDGEDHTGRHLFTFFQVEIEWLTESVEEVYEVVESILEQAVGELLSRLESAGRADRSARTRLGALANVPYPRVAFAEARARAAGVGGAENPHAAGDLTHAEESSLSRAASGPFWLTDYPDGVRDSLYRRTPAGMFATYDLILPRGHGEVATGGLRPDSADDIVRQAQKLSGIHHSYYAEWKARTGLQSGGIGFGLERLVRYCADADSVLDLRFAHDHGPNARIRR